MIPLDEAQAHVRSRCPSPVVESVPLAGALGLVLAEDVVSAEDVPPFANTAMDGFAVRAGDTAGAPVCLAVVGTIAAGAAPDVAVGEGEAVRIMTGAPMPPGADAVVMVERTRVLDDGAGEQVEVEVEVPVGNHVRQAGEDLLAGQVVLAAGIPLVPGRIGVLASVNRSEVRAFRRPRVGVVSTGDELVADGSALAPGQIRDSNRPGLLALVAESGFTPVDLGLVPDREDAIEAALRDGVAGCDAVLTTGGVSMGDFDYVKVVLDRIGDMRWMQVAIRPAKPLAFGTVDGVPVFGLPGNPVSSMVSFELFARPALRAMAGHADVERRRIRAVAATAMPRRPDGKTHFARVVLDELDGAVRVSSSGGQGSHQLTAMAGADGLAVLPDGDGVAAGDQVEVLLLR
ncbi:MAG: molybdopterin molybdenumtransferase MoeA [Acidimicrobiaceae bacterium]|nr:molybdopterin molybdenumtransferase MoeA [Acidimicrobiaceae bacterium]